MNHCIKCGKEIVDGELFCIECSLNPGSSLFEEPRQMTQTRGRMQTPQPVRRPVAQTVDIIPPEEKKPAAVKLKVALAVVSVLLAAALGLMIWQQGRVRVERTRLETREADLLLQAAEADELRVELEGLNGQLAELKAEIEEKEAEIADLEKQLSGSMSSQSQSEYDLSTTQAELARLQEENEQLLLLEEELSEQVDTLSADLEALEQESAAYEAKANFMDNYVVFVENNNSGYYHTYDCGNFSKKNFWAYSRKLAESNGFEPCPVCGGRP